MHAESYERHSSLEKYTSHFIWKGCVWEGVGDGTELQHIDPHSIGHNCISYPFSWAAQLGAWGPTLLGACFLYRILSLTDWTSCAPSYIIIPLIQPVHSQGYILIFLDRMHLLFTQVHFLFWQPSQVGGQYTTLKYCKTFDSPKYFPWFFDDLKSPLS